MFTGAISKTKLRFKKNSGRSVNKKTALFYAIDVNTEKLDIVTMILDANKNRVNDVANDGSTP